MHYHRRRGWELPESMATPEALVMSRRQTLGLGAALGARLESSHRLAQDRSAVAGRASAPAGDALVDEVTRRVMERLAPSVVNDVVADAVTRVAERMVREELDRIKGIRD